MVFGWSLSDSKSPKVSRTLLSILAILNNAVVWMVSTHPPTSKSSSLFNNLLVTVPKAPIMIGIIVTFIIIIIIIIIIIPCDFLVFFSFSFNFTLWSPEIGKSTIRPVLFFFFFVDYYKVWSCGQY